MGATNSTESNSQSENNLVLPNEINNTVETSPPEEKTLEEEPLSEEEEEVSLSIYRIKDLAKFINSIFPHPENIITFLDQTPYASNYIMQMTPQFFGKGDRIIVEHCDSFSRSITTIRDHLLVKNICDCAKIALTREQASLLSGLNCVGNINIDDVDYHPLVKYKSE